MKQLIRNFLISFLFLILALLIGQPILGQSPAGVLLQTSSAEFVPGELLVKFSDNAGLFLVQNTLTGFGIRPLSVSPYSGVMRVQVPPGQENVLMAALLAQPQVEYAEPNYIISVARLPFDFYFSSQWGLDNFGQSGGSAGADISALEAWDITTGNSDVVIAVVDSGIDRSHPDLMDRTWRNGFELYGTPGVDDDNNGYVDDIYGWDFCNSPDNSSAVRCTSPEDPDPSDEYGHGTRVAGIAAATGNNGIGVTGVSWRARLMSVKSQDQYRFGTVSSVSDAVNYAVANGADFVNLSLSIAVDKSTCQSYTTLRTAVEQATASGVLVVAASGNNSSISQVSCPASLDDAVAVGATNDFDMRAWFSNSGPELDVVAPGEEIYSTEMGGTYDYDSGTSFSTPFVTGLFALLKSYSPALKYSDIRSVIEVTTDDKGSPGFDNLYGHGRINAHQALEAVVSFRTFPGETGFLFADNSPNPSITATTNIQLISNDSSTVNWTATISPSVSWLGIESASFGAISSASSPMQLTLVATRPTTYTSDNTSVIIESNIGGQNLGSRTTTIFLQYIEVADLNYLPVIMKN